MADLKLYYAPKTRAFTILWLLEELGVEYELESFDIMSGRHKNADFVALNRMGKIPLVVHEGRGLAETGAIAIHLCDLFGSQKLAPGIGEEARGDYLRWVFFSSGVMEPAYGEKLFKWEVPKRSVAWGCFDDMLQTLEAGLEGKDYLLGDNFSAADVIVGNTLRFGQLFGPMPKDGVLGDYSARLAKRDGFKAAMAIEKREIERFSDDA